MDALSGDRLAGAEVVIALIYRCSIIPSYRESWAGMWSMLIGCCLETETAQGTSSLGQFASSTINLVWQSLMGIRRWRKGTFANKSVESSPLWPSFVSTRPSRSVTDRKSLVQICYLYSARHSWRPVYNICFEYPRFGSSLLIFFFFFPVLKELKWRLAKTTTMTMPTMPFD